MNSVYPDIKDTPLYKKILKNLEEASKQYLASKIGHLTLEKVNNFNQSINKLMATVNLADRVRIKKETSEEIKNNFITSNIS